MKRFFSVCASKYDENKQFEVYYPASLDKPRCNAVMFVNDKNIHRLDRLQDVHSCIIFYPASISLPPEVCRENVTIASDDPRVSYCLFFRENGITCLPPKEKVRLADGAYLAETAVIGANTTIMPGAYIGGEVELGENVYIGAGTKLIGRVRVGNRVVIRENSVIGADGLSTDRDANGHAATMPQFGGVVIGDDVQIGALTVIARGAIDDTRIEAGAKIDNSTFISHNVVIGADTFVVGESIFFGGSSTGERAFVSGNSTVRNKAHIGSEALVGMASVVTRNIPDGQTVFGNPARPKE